MVDAQAIHLCPHGGPLPVLRRLTRAVFLDRDGLLIPDTGYPSDPDAVTLLPGVGEGLRRLQAADFLLVVVTNQSGLARGYFSLETLEAIHERLHSLLHEESVRLDALYFCPHHPEARVAEYVLDCDHRKPMPGMLLSAAGALQLDLSQCWMLGDRSSDVVAGHAAGCRALLVNPEAHPDGGGAPNLLAAAEHILTESTTLPHPTAPYRGSR